MTPWKPQRLRGWHQPTNDAIRTNIITAPDEKKDNTHTAGSGQQTEPFKGAKPNRAKYRGTQPKRLAAIVAWAPGAGSTPGRQGTQRRDIHKEM